MQQKIINLPNIILMHGFFIQNNTIVKCMHISGECYAIYCNKMSLYMIIIEYKRPNKNKNRNKTITYISNTGDKMHTSKKGDSITTPGIS
jgi:hypothetical protein